MAQQAPIQLDLSTLRSDGTGQGPQGASRAHYIQVTNQDPAYQNHIQALTAKFNADAHLVATYGRHQFIGDLPNGYTLWTHQTGGQTAVLELYGNPRGPYYRSAARFSGHVGELITANNASDAQVRARVQAQNQDNARQAIIVYNVIIAHRARFYGMFGYQRDPNNMNHAHDLPWTSLDANAEVLADQQNHAALVFTCTCVFR